MHFETETDIENEDLLSPVLSPNEFEEQSTFEENRVEFNDELFLKHVCNYPSIYNSQLKGYSNRNQKFRAWENIARSMNVSVEFCTKRLKSLREKYNREKQKIESMYRSGAPATSVPKWQYMSFFEFMYDKTKPRQTSSSSILREDSVPSPGTSTSHNLSATTSQVCVEMIPVSHSTPRGTKRKPEKEDPVVNVLQQIGNALEANPATPRDKISEFGSYLTAEMRDLPSNEQEEFMDETIIRLLQVKRRNRKK